MALEQTSESNAAKRTEQSRLTVEFPTFVSWFAPLHSSSETAPRRHSHYSEIASRST